MQEIAGTRLSAICRRCFRWRCRRWGEIMWGGRPRPPACALQFLIIGLTAPLKSRALIRTSAFDLEVHCRADNEAAQPRRGGILQPRTQVLGNLRTSESRRDGRNET